MPKPSIAIIGCGVVGQAIGRILRQKRFRISGVAGTSAASAKAAVAFIGSGNARLTAASAARGADVIFLATPDRMIRTVCERIVQAKAVKRHAVIFHCSGAYGAELLDLARTRKAHVASLHPLQSFASPEAAVKRMKGTYFTFDGDKDAAPVAEQIVNALGGRMLRLPPKNKALYHAASCVLSNYMVGLADLGMIMLQLSGLSEKEASRAAKPLMAGTLENIGKVGLPHALTGPIARGDVDTVERHLRALARLPKEIRKLYCELGLYTVRVAQRKGTLHPPEARHLVKLFLNVSNRSNG